MAETFTCAACGQTFDKAWSDDEADAEARDLFGVDKAEDPSMAVVCDHCFQEMGFTDA